MSKHPALRFGHTLRLNQNRDIQTTCQKGRKLTSPFMAIFFAPNTLNHPRLCVSVSKKHIPKAVTRHRIKRLVRESFRHQQHTLPALDLVVIIYKSCRDLDSKIIREKIDHQWQRLLAPRGSTTSGG